MLDIDQILAGKIAHMMRSCAPTKKEETYCCSICSYCDVTDCETVLEKDISELQTLINNHAGVKLEQLEREKLEAERCLHTSENLQMLLQYPRNFRGWETGME